jgi:hypothetical protein
MIASMLYLKIYTMWVVNTKSRENDKFRPRRGHQGLDGEYRYSSTLSLTSALDGGGWSKPRPGRFTPRKEIRYPFYRRLGESKGRSGRVLKISPSPALDHRAVQPVASHYTDWAIQAHLYCCQHHLYPAHQVLIDFEIFTLLRRCST